jgi:hypothetical protein
MANALRKNTTCPSGTVSPTWRTNADITANSSTETSLLEMARRRFMGRSAVLSAVLGKGGKLALPRVARATPPVLAWGVARWKQAAIADPQRCRDINALPGIKASQIAEAR